MEGSDASEMPDDDDEVESISVTSGTEFDSFKIEEIPGRDGEAMGVTCT